MAEPEQLDLILGSGQGGKLLAWHMARSGRQTAVVERPVTPIPGGPVKSAPLIQER
jgi:choline dehydrogenase-like flavoprotein